MNLPCTMPSEINGNNPDDSIAFPNILPPPTYSTYIQQ